MEAVMSTSAARGSRTSALWKNVVNPNVSPKPGRTLGCLRAILTVVPAAVGAGGRTDFAILDARNRRRPVAVGTLTFMVAADDQYRPASGFEQCANTLYQARDFAKAQNQPLPRRFA